MTLANEVFVLGVGMSRFGGPYQPLDQRIIEASLEAIDDSGVPFPEVQSLYLGTSLTASTYGPPVVKDLGLTGIPITRIENASATGGATFYEAVHAVGSGRLDLAMAIAFDDPATSAVPDFNDVEDISPILDPFIPPMAFFSMWAVRRMADHGTTPETLAAIATKNWNNARLNPKAERQATEEITVERVLGSRMLAYPHTARMAAPQGAGAAAVIVGSRKSLERFDITPTVRVAAAQAHSERYGEGHLFTGAIIGPPEMVRRAAFTAYEEAGVGPEDLGAIAFHDAYAIEELLYYEAIGLCEAGEGDRLVHDGETALTGRFPTSTDGGFIGRGHPSGPTGIAQIWELTHQVRGTAGDRQVAKPSNALAHIVGAGSVCYTHILQSV